MKKLLLLIGMLLLVLSAASPAIAQDGDTTPDAPQMAPMIFLPLVNRQASQHVVTGQIKDAQDMPLSGVTVGSTSSTVGVTDANGVYRIITMTGNQKIVAEKEGYNFEPGTADLNVTRDMYNLNFTAVSKDEASLLGCANLLLNPNFEGADGWTISPAVNPSYYTSQYFFSPVWSMASGVPVGYANPFPGVFTTAEFWQPTTIAIPLEATIVNLRMRVLPRSSDLWGYHLAEQAAMDATFSLNSPEAVESQYAHIRDAANTTTLRQLFKWFPIDSYYWLYRSYDLRDFRGQTISVLFGAINDGDAGNTALYVDDVYLYYCTP